MHLDRKFLLVVGLSLLWALVVSAVFYRVAVRASSRGPAQAERNLIVAAQILPIGASIQPQYLKTVRVPEALFPKGGFSRPEEVLERPVMSSILAEEPVLEGRLAARGSGMGLGPMIPPGMRAISVRVNEVVGVSGFVLPGMRVDVLVTGRPPGQDNTFTKTVLQNVPVLSAGQTLQVDPKTPSITAPVVTLLVSPAQAESLTLANNEGHIQLVLRNSNDQEAAGTSGRNLRELYDHAKVAPPVAAAAPRAARRSAAPAPAPAPPQAPPPAAAPPPPADEVVIIRGIQKSVEAAAPTKGESK
jgi:pilus assembly protein CpaB